MLDDPLRLLALLPFLGVAGAVLWIGYVAYDARRARERLGAAARQDPRVHAEDLARVNSLMQAELREARALLGQARDTLRRGLKG